MNYRLETLMMRERAMERVEALIDDQLKEDLSQDKIDTLIKDVCDVICETIDPVGFPY